MRPGRNEPWTRADSALQVYLLGTVEFEAALRFQRRMHYEVTGDRDQAILIVCEHPPLITVGRQGSRAHIFYGQDELRSRQWSIRWVNRGGGCLLHLPGQLAIYPIFPLDRLGLNLPDYLGRLHRALKALLDDFSLAASTREQRPGLWVGPRPIAGVGVSVRDWVSYFGAWLNLDPDLEPLWQVRWGGTADEPMTSLVRERKLPLRPGMVRQRLVEQVRDAFGFDRVSLFSDHPALDGCSQRCHDAITIKGSR